MDLWRFANHKANQYANALRQMGVKKGDRVGILLYNCLEYFALYFAIAKLGAIAVRINFRLTSEEFAYILNDSGTEILCLHSNIARIAPIRNGVQVKEYLCLEKEGHSIPKWSKSWRKLEEENGTGPVHTDIDKADPVMLMYTSGTTGSPKGALWSHENTLWFANMQILKWGLNAKTIGMSTGPLYHVGAMEDLVIPTLLVGGTIIVTQSGGFEIERVANVIEKGTSNRLLPVSFYDL